MSDKYRSTEDLLAMIKELEDKVSKLERNPRIGNTAIDSGGLTVNGGDIIVKDTNGVEIIKIFKSDPPEIRFAPLGDDTTHVASIFAQEETIFGVDQTAGRFQIRTVPGLLQDGGGVLLYNNGARLSHVDNATGAEGGYEAGIFNSTPGIVRIFGRWLNTFQISSTDAVITGSVTSGVANSVTITYTITFATTIVPVLGFLSTAGAVSWSITAQSTSAFTVAWTGAAAAKTINMWNTRL